MGYTDPAGNLTSYTYDANARVTSLTSPKGETISFTYVDYETTAITDARGHVTTVIFNGSGDISDVFNPLGNLTQFYFDGNMQSGYEHANGAGWNISYPLPLDNGLIPVKIIEFADGGEILFTYDTTNFRLSSVTDELGRTATLVWDAGSGQRTAVIDPLGGYTTYSYNARGQITALIDPLGHTTTFAYDTVGNLTSIQQPLGEVTTFGYTQYNQWTSTEWHFPSG